MTYTCSDLPFTAAYHHDLTDMISPGQAAVLPGYAGGGKRKRNKTRKKTRKLRKKRSSKKIRKSTKRNKSKRNKSKKRSRKSIKK
jgi:hypothetical protein